MTTSTDPLGRWPVRLELPVAWGDMDALAHVNNLVYLRWFESARIVYFERLGLIEAMNARQVGPILARQEIDYRRPVAYPDTVRVETTTTRLGKTSFTMAFRIEDRRGDRVAEGQGVMVMVDYATGKSVPIDARLRQAVVDLEAGRR